MKADRHAKILELISHYEIETQEELAAQLLDAGFRVTQATVSRDIRELGLSKVPGHQGRQRYACLSANESTQQNDKFTRAFQDAFLTAKVAAELVVIKTVSGMAMSVALALDAMEIPGMVGCIAGDDTVFCAVESEAQIPQVMEMIDQIISDRRQV